MAKTVSVLTASETRLLERAHAALGTFLDAQRPPKPAPVAGARPARKRSHKKKGTAGAPALTKSGQPRKPTGAAAHKSKKATAATVEAPAEGAPAKTYPAVMFDQQQQDTLAEIAATEAAEAPAAG